MKTIETVKEYAQKCHEDANHKYDGADYINHLQMVVDYAIKYAHLIDVTYVDCVVCACYCHDLIEDARQTYNDVKEATNSTVAELVYAVTNEKGRTRKDRANDKYYADMRVAGENAVFVKICDRLANIKYSVATESSMLNAYRKEREHFYAQLFTAKFNDMWEEMDRLLVNTK